MYPINLMITVINFVRFWNETSYRELKYVSKPTYKKNRTNYSKAKQNFNPLTPNDLYMSRTAPLTSKRCILYIYSTNVGTEYFKHALYSPFFLFKMQFVP